MLHEPLPSMMRMEPMVAIDAEYDEPSHHLILRRLAQVLSLSLPLALTLALALSRFSDDVRSRHRVRRTQPETAHTATRHMSTAPRTYRPRHGVRA